jgi:CRP-like cAMP-binding protein
LKILDKAKAFDVAFILAIPGAGSKQLHYEPKESLFSQGDLSDTVFYLQSGRAKLTVVSEAGKEATIRFYSPGDFIGEGAMAEDVGPRLATASAVNTCSAIKIKREEMIRLMHEDFAFNEFFMKFLLERSVKSQADLVDQLFNSSEKRLARVLLLMAEFGKPGERATYIPPVSQETLAEMIGTTRSRVSFFMNRFRALGLISYNGRIQVHNSLLNVVLLDQFPGHSAQKPLLETLLKATIPVVAALSNPTASAASPVKPKRRTTNIISGA